MIEFQEHAYGRMEATAVRQLAALQAGDVTYFDDDDQAVSFSYFLVHQYLRTKAIRDRIRDTFPTQAQKDRFERTWPIFRYIYATNVGYTIFAHRKTMKLQVVRAAPGMEFITSDQPAINTHGAFVSADTAIDDLELFYPVSPSRALIISGHGIYQDSHGKPLEPFHMYYLNQAIERVAYDCLFAQSERTLNAIAPYLSTQRT